MDIKRVTLFAGHYGSGKTNIAVNFAKYLKDLGKKVTIIDLDIVNPYFRTKDSEEDFKTSGIKLVCSEYANTNLDIPALPKEIYGALSDRESFVIIDVGGDDAGAVALGRYVPQILEENDYNMLYVANCFRPLTKTAKDALSVMREIENASGIKFTAIVNNSNLGCETDEDCIKNSVGFINELSDISNLPIYMTTAEAGKYSGLEDCFSDLFYLKLQNKKY